MDDIADAPELVAMFDADLAEFYRQRLH